MNLKYKNLYLFVEGDDDSRFFKSVIKPMFDKFYKTVKVQQYKHQKKEKFIATIKSIISYEDHYIFFADLDKRICIKEKKEKITTNIELLSDEDITF